MSTRSRLSTDELISAIVQHSAGLIDAARGHFDIAVAGCPGWSVADLVHHLTEVQWFWGTITGDRLTEPPGDDVSGRPQPEPEETAALQRLAAMTTRLVAAVTGDQQTPVWTWAPVQQTVGFVTRHQVQEAAVHHFDAATAAGVAWSVEPEVAADSVDEFLTVSIGTTADPADADRPPLGQRFALVATDTGDRWVVGDDDQPGTLSVVHGTGEDAGVPTLQAPAADLLLWLYGRRELTGSVPAEVLARFRGLSFTD